jgi:tRNA-2-methylthio-N6-dimethylallyladenosine synthase
LTFFFETYGCQMNSAESAALVLVCRERGWTPAVDGEHADLVVLNTCSVRITAEQRVHGRIALYASIKKKRPAGKAPALVVAGCMAERLGEELKKEFPAVDYVMGTRSRVNFPFILEALEQGGEAAFPALPIAGFPCSPGEEKPAFSFSESHLDEGQFRSFVPIMHGCNNFCSYCIVPYVRGREVSRDPDFIAREIRLVAERGVKEITLLGQNVNTYRWQGEVDFPGLLRMVSEEAGKSGIRRVRFLSANPKDFSTETIRVMAENPCFCRHLHLPVQHGSNRILQAMNRRYTRERYIDLVREIRAAMPDISLSTDILVGFPGETEDDLALTLELMEEVTFLYAYMYHYNPREGTAAFNLPDRIAENVKRERLSRVIALQKKHTSMLLKSRIGSREVVLVEGISRKNADELICRTERDEMAVVDGHASLTGSFVEVVLSGLKGNTFRAQRVQNIKGA